MSQKDKWPKSTYFYKELKITNQKEDENYRHNEASPCPCQKGHHGIDLKHKIKACKDMKKETCINYWCTSSLASQYSKQYEISF